MQRVHVDRRLGLQPRYVNLLKFRREDGELDVEGFEHAVDTVFHRPGDPRRLLELPDARDRPKREGLPPARPRLREPRRAPDGTQAPVRLGRGRAYAAAITGLMTGRAYRKSAEIASRMGAFWATSRTPAR